MTPFLFAPDIRTADQIGLLPLDAHLSIGSVLHGLRGIVEAETFGRYRRWGIVGDVIYASLTLEPKLPIPDYGHTNLQAGLGTIAPVFVTPPFHVSGDGNKAFYLNGQVFAGAAYSDLAVTNRTNTRETFSRLAAEWWMPTVGGQVNGQRGRYVTRIGGEFTHFGGNTTGEELLGAVGYKFEKRSLGSPAIQLGYRYLFEKNVLSEQEVLRLRLQGPSFFITFHLW